ncbi:MAG: type II toxin-antitoxin system VapC family toxin [Bifidobacteriaceae bacterium]|jgi:predicted nucleic acid-binding protein|nr:type II toxin-antitoxin system VapC family toxin [Bifidobacteriaceae bacterium]
MGCAVLDASAAVWLLLDPGHRGEEVAATLANHTLAAPALLPCEVANVIRRRCLAGLIAEGQGRLAVAGLMELAVDLWPWEAVAEQVWHMRESITAYDASYVALARLVDAPLVTADTALAQVAGRWCTVTAV